MKSLLSRVTGRFALGPALVVAGALLSAPAFAAPDVVARVNGKDITRAELDMALDVFADQLAQVPEAQREPMVVDALIDMHVVADAAEKAGVEQSDKFKARMNFLTAQALRNTFIETEVQGKISDDEIKARYEKDIAGYKPPEEVHARHILVKTEDEAKAVIKQLADGGDFDAIAKEKSQDPGSKDHGGDLGFFSRGQMVPEFEDAAFAMKPGEISQTPVKTQFGYHVIKIEEKRTQPVPTLAEVHDQVVQVLQREKFQDLMTKLKAEAKVENFEPAPAMPAMPAMPGMSDAPADAAPADAAPAPAK